MAPEHKKRDKKQNLKEKTKLMFDKYTRVTRTYKGEREK